MTLAEERKHKRAVAEKTQKKFILVRKKEKESKLKGKIDSVIKMSIRLTASERRNKARGFKEKEHATKEKLIKMQIAHVKGRRHARHKHQYARFVKSTLKKQMKKAKTATRVAVAMKQNMKQ